MLKLANTSLEVEILDPVRDLNRCGSRYCVGGYIYQVLDKNLGPLLSGPQYPRANPDVFHGQGAPEQFVRVLGEDADIGDEVAVIGVGRVRRTGEARPMFARYNPEVLSFLPWTVEQTDTKIVFRSEDEFRGFAYELTRTVRLDGRAVLSETHISNRGLLPIPVEWYAHPFFPACLDRICCKPSAPVVLKENPGYFLNSDGFIQQKVEGDWAVGYYLELSYAKSSAPLSVVQRHPKLGQLITKTDFPPARLPIWSNDCTFSFEPYFIEELLPRHAAAFAVTYEF
ncbi:MAG: hypothetical protein SFV15_19720 [Polyangiaceae bacterium]|nr:hypothetical protein [Polyangiaceae bacterium]